jgi:hypothetical protein
VSSILHRRKANKVWQLAKAGIKDGERAPMPVEFKRQHKSKAAPAEYERASVRAEKADAAAAKA